MRMTLPARGRLRLLQPELETLPDGTGKVKYPFGDPQAREGGSPPAEAGDERALAWDLVADRTHGQSL